jgi:hypothetical protein
MTNNDIKSRMASVFEKEMGRAEYELNEKISAQIKKADESLRKIFEKAVKYQEKKPHKLQKLMLKTVKKGKKKQLIFWDENQHNTLFCKALQCDVEARIKLLEFLCSAKKDYTKRLSDAIGYPVRLEVWTYHECYGGVCRKRARIYLMWD